MKGLVGVGRKWAAVSALLGSAILGLASMPSSKAYAQVVPPARTVQETPTLQNDTLKPVDYRNKYEVYGGLGSSHFNAGPALIPGANLGGLDIQGTMWLRPRIGATANVRGYYGTTGVVPNAYNIHGPFIMEHQFMAGPTFRGGRRMNTPRWISTRWWVARTARSILPSIKGSPAPTWACSTMESPWRRRWADRSISIAQQGLPYGFPRTTC